MAWGEWQRGTVEKGYKHLFYRGINTYFTKEKEKNGKNT
jgi:hypothetical protein